MQTKQELFSLEKSSENKWLNEEIIKLLNLQMSNLFIKDESQENDMVEWFHIIFLWTLSDIKLYYGS